MAQKTVLTVPVRTSPWPPGGARYDVRIGRALLVGVCDGLIGAGQRVLVVHDGALPHACVAQVTRGAARAGAQVHTLALRATEAGKSLASAEKVCGAAAGARLERGDLMVALGGGVIGDLAGFAAAIYRRGVRFVQCPTTLLSMVDASVGGKTGVNLRVGGALQKNMAGAFHQPSRVVADVATLASLPRREMASGLAECVKHGLIGGGLGEPDLLLWTGARAPRVLALHAPSVSELVHRNVRLKARVVAGDERETASSRQGGRMLLNLGHTFGHAIETLPRLTRVRAGLALGSGHLLHGEAVALGLVAACRVSEELGLSDRGLSARVIEALERCELPTGVRGLPAPGAVIDAMRADKKVAGGRLRLVLPVRAMKARVVEGVDEAVLARVIEAWAR
jgi:3-dehydroquinate synthase